MTNNIKICSRCIMDTTDPLIKFDKNGICQYCKMHEKLEKKYPIGEKGEQKLSEMVTEIKKRGEHKKYDCIVDVNVSGNIPYTLLTAVKLGLQFAVTFDNGWEKDII